MELLEIGLRASAEEVFCQFGGVIFMSQFRDFFFICSNLYMNRKWRSAFSSNSSVGMKEMLFKCCLDGTVINIAIMMDLYIWKKITQVQGSKFQPYPTHLFLGFSLGKKYIMNRYENKLVVNVAVAVVVRWKSSKRENPAINVLGKKKHYFPSFKIRKVKNVYK